MKSVFYQEANVFLQDIFEQCNSLGVILPQHWDIDHLCFRVEDQHAYEHYKREFLEFGQLLVESPVAGRMISTFILDRPIEFNQWKIELIELPAPKEGKIVKEGFEHLEIVCDVQFCTLNQLFPQAQFETKGLSKTFNPEFEMKLKEKNIKFHHLSLRSVIELECHPVVWKSLEELQILENYQQYGPLVAGTYPLGISHDKSDVDLLLYAEDLDSLADRISRDFSLQKSFKLTRSLINDESTVFCSFYYNGLLFEIFAQARPAVEQVAYQHFLCEEKILKYGDPSVREKVRRLKSGGMKTEPAFGEVLSLEGDPYQRLLDLQKVSIQKLREIL